MADKRITQLNGLSNVDANDLFAVVDVSAQETKKVSYSNLLPAGTGGSGLGWARYDDSQYTTSSFFTVTDGAQPVVIPNNASNSIETHMNSSLSFYNHDGNNKIHMENDGDVYQMVIVFKAKAPNANQTHIDLSLSSTGLTPYDRVSKTLLFGKGNDVWENFYESFHFYGDSDFVANGNQWKISASGGDVHISDVIYFIQRTYNAG